MKSTLSSDSREEFQQTADLEGKQTSMTRVFTLFLLIFFVLQVVIGAAVIYFYVGESMRGIQERSIHSGLKNYLHLMDTYIDDRVAVLEDYANLPVLASGVMRPGANSASTADFLDSLTLMRKKSCFALLDFQGHLIHATQDIPGLKITGGKSFQNIVEGKVSHSVDIIQGGGDTGHYWRIAVPVLYLGLPEGVLAVYIPIDFGSIFDPGEGDYIRLRLHMGEETIASTGNVSPPFLSGDIDPGFPGVTLLLDVSRELIDEEMRTLLKGMIVSLLIGTSLLLFLLHMLGKRLLIVPHAKLQAMSAELENRVTERTRDLLLKTEQLAQEVQERKQAEKEVREKGELLEVLLDGLQAAFFILEPVTGKVVDINDVAEKIFCVTREEVVGQLCSAVFTKAAKGEGGLLCPGMSEKAVYKEGQIVDAKGATIPVARHVVSMRMQGKEHLAVILFNIVERKNMERKLNIAQKLESIGQLASGIAHEINTPIQYVGDSVRFIQEAFKDLADIQKVESELLERNNREGTNTDLVRRVSELAEEADLEFLMEEVPRACSRALDGADRVATIVKAMKNFSHPGEEEKKAVDINKAIATTVTVAKNEWKYVADVNLTLGELPLVQCFQGDINQALLNVLVNAAHAVAEVVGGSGEKGKIDISSRLEEAEVEIRIRDTGNGILPENQDKIFDPFFTTKEVGKGTGQGLAIVHDIVVEKHGGSIDLESKPGNGTTFIIRLPLREDEVEAG